MIAAAVVLMTGLGKADLANPFVLAGCAAAAVGFVMMYLWAD